MPALRIGAALTSVAVMILAVSLLPQTLGGPAQPTPSPTAPTPSPTAPTPSPTAAPSASAGPFEGRGVPVLETGQRATALGSGFGSLWLGDVAGRLLRIDPSGPRVIATLDLGAVPCGPIVAAATSIWLTTCGDGLTSDSAITVRVDPNTSEVVTRYDSGGGNGVGVAAMNGLVWFVSDFREGRLAAVDAGSGELIRELSIGSPIRHMTAGFGSLWASPIGRPAVLRLDPETGGQQAEIALSGDPAYLHTTSDAIWVAEPQQWLVARIDPVADRVAAEIGASPGVDHLVIDDSGRVWTLSDDQVMAVNPATNLTVDRFAVPPHVGLDGVAMDVLAVLGDTLWFADGQTLVRIAPR